RLRRAQDEAQRSQAAMNQAAASAGINTGVQGGIPGQAIIGPNGQPYYPAAGNQPTVVSEKSAIEQDKEKREYASLFASNVALSYRKPAEAGTIEPAGREPVKDTAPEPHTSLGSADGHKLFEGTVLEAVLTNRLEGSFSGPVNCQVTVDVYSH